MVTAQPMKHTIQHAHGNFDFRCANALFFLLAFSLLRAQENRNDIVGKVSFISTQNVYVRFKSTDGISVGDTLFMSSEGKQIAVLKVTGLSSTSCVCTSISDVTLPVDHLIIARAKSGNEKAVSTPVKDDVPIVAVTSVTDSSSKPISAEKGPRQDIRGSISANSYSDFSDTGLPDSYRFRYSLSLDARNIADSKFSLESYMSFRHKAGEWDTIKSNIFNGLKIFNLAARYDLNESTRFALGRKINNRIASIGAIDGFQAEKSFGNISIGAVAGFRPDYADFGFNSSLFEYGAYMGLDTKGANGYSGNTIAFMQQMNNSVTDRRFLYFQHSSSLAGKVSLFSTFEVDLYKLENDQPKSTFDLTSFYFSLRYRVTNKLSLSGSYDTRENVMYYETYKTFIDRVLEEERRQGFRLQADYSVNDYIIVGVNSGYRYLKSDPDPSKNINGYLTFRQIPGMKLFSSTISGTYLTTSFIDGWIAAINLSRYFLDGKVQPGLGFRYVNYDLPENGIKIIQNIAELNLSVNITKKLYFSVNYEGTFEASAKYNRIYLQLRQRF